MLRWLDGFEHQGSTARLTEGVGGAAAWSQVDDAWNLSSANPATGDYQMRLTSNANVAQRLRRAFGTTVQTFGFGYRFSVASLPSFEGLSGSCALLLADVRDASNDTQFVVLLGTDGAVEARRLSSVTAASLGGTFLGRSDPCVAPGGYHHFELRGIIDNSTGAIEVRINEVTVLNLTGIDTQSTTNASAAQISITRSGSILTTQAAEFGHMDVDDVFMWDEDDSDPENTVVDFVGDKGAYYLPPVSDTATSEFDITGTGSPGVAWQALDEVPPTFTEKLSTTATTARTIVGIGALPENVSEITALMPVAYAQRDESGSATFRLGLVSGAEETYGPDDTPSTAGAYVRPGPKTIDPNTSAAWAADALPDLLIERTA